MMPLDLDALDILLSADDENRIDFETNYKFYSKYFQSLEPSYTWVFNTDLSLNAKIASTESIMKINQIYWGDVFQSISAAEQVFYRRAHTLLTSSYSALTSNDFLSSAILTRSLLEVCMWNVYHSAIFENCVKGINKNPQKFILGSPEMQDSLLKLMWGSNEKHVIDEVKQHKVYKIFDKVAKATKQSNLVNVDIEKTYDALSEFVHPNTEGNNVFIAWDINGYEKPTTEVNLDISFVQNDDKRNKPSKAILQALNWCVPSIIFSSQKYTNVRKKLIVKFKLNNKKHLKIH
jgi:hypothetical protein